VTKAAGFCAARRRQAGPPPIAVDTLLIEGKEHAVRVLKTTLFRADW